jgi:hypothetical protein
MYPFFHNFADHEELGLHGAVNECSGFIIPEYLCHFAAVVVGFCFEGGPQVLVRYNFFIFAQAFVYNL